MKDGFVKAAAATPDIRVADVAYNTENICKMIDETVANGAKVIVFPELCVTGYTCSDLFMQDILLKEAKEALFKIADYTKEKDALIFIGVPLAVDGELYNASIPSGTGYGKVDYIRWKENSIRATAPICGRTDGGTGRFGRDL